MSGGTEKEYTKNQLEQIALGEQEGLDTSCYADPSFNAMQMLQIRLGLKAGVAVEKYTDPAYVSFQMEEIRRGLEEGLDTSLYDNVKIPYEKMKQIREGLEQGIDLSQYLKLPAGMLEVLRKAVLAKVNIMPYVKAGYIPEQLEEIIPALQKGLDIQKYLKPALRGVAIREIVEGLEMGLDVSIYAREDLDWRQMKQIRLGLENRVDISCYDNHYFNWRQMRQIRLGLEEGIDVSGYANLMYTAADMERLRLKAEKDFVGDLLADAQPKKMDGVFAVVIDADEMTACLVYSKQEETYTYEEIVDILERNSVRRGYQEDAIRRIAEGKAEDGEVITVAQGQPATDGTDGYYEYFFRTEVARTPKHLADGSVDYQDVEWFEIVQENQKIVEYHNAQSGIPGYTVTGRIVPAHRGKEKRMLHGKGFHLSKDRMRYYSSMTGRIELKGEELVISRLYIYDEVTMATGNVDVDGNVYVKGNVGSNTVIKATEDIAVDGFIESAYLESKENIFLRRGMNAAGNGLVRAGKSVCGKFFESVRVEAGEDIYCNYSMDANLWANGLIVLSGEKGTLLGGSARAVGGFRIYNAGNQVGVPTYIRMGADETLHNAVYTIETRVNNVEKELRALQNGLREYQSKYPPEVRNTMDIFLKLENAIYTKEEEYKQLLDNQIALNEQLKKASEATGMIRGRLYGGVIIEIDGAKWAAKQVDNVVVRKVNNRVAIYKN